jgi:hypothetical protein
MYYLQKQNVYKFKNLNNFFQFFFAVLELELRAYTLSHSTNPFFVMGLFKIGSCKLFA